MEWNLERYKNITSGEFFFFGTRYRSEMRKDEMNWARAYQNYLSNFIRTGDPNGKKTVMTRLVQRFQYFSGKNSWKF